MDRLSVLQNLTHCMIAAAAEGNWEALMRVNSQVGSVLSELAGQGAWSAAELSAINELRCAHQEASARCTRELTYLADRLTDMRAHHSGWRAYAASGELAEESQA